MSKMNRRRFLRTAAGSIAGVSAGWLSGQAGAANKRPPNVIVILADDLGAKELSCYGNTAHQTPHLDKLAETGVKFETCYATPLCHPTRLEIMTGQYGCHNGVYNFAGRRGGPEPDAPVEDIAKSHVTFANLLKKQGYATAHAGKWQLSGAPPTLITECDFDEYCAWAYLNYLPEGVTHAGGMEGDKKPSRYWNPCLMKNGVYVPTKPDDYGPDIHTDFVIDFATCHKDKPFLIYYCMCLTHAPHYPTPDSFKPGMDKFKNSPANFKADVEYVDKLVGRIVAALEKLGLCDNTLLFFTGDNGTGGQGKGEPTELGARVPMIVNAPGLVKPRGARMELTDLSDVLPTLCEFAGTPLPKDRVIDGVSLAPYLRGKTDKIRDWVFSYLADRRVLRTKRWLLEDNSPLHYGRLYDCGDSRNGSGYKDVTSSDADEVKAIKDEFNALLAKLPAPVLSEEGPAAGPKDSPRGGRRAEKGTRKRQQAEE